MSLIFESVRRMRSRPVRAVKRAVAGGSFLVLGSGPQQAFCRSAYTPALLATIVLGGIGIPAAHENSPGVRLGPAHARAVMRDDRSLFSGG